MKIMKIHLRALAILLGAALVTGCAGSGHVGESWQCPLAQGTACQSVSEADPAARAPGEVRDSAFPVPLRPMEKSAYSVLNGLIVWFTELFRHEEEQDAGAATAEPLVVGAQAPLATAESLYTPVVEETSFAPHENLRTKERVARIWIAPYVDAHDNYHEGYWVRTVMKPAGWRLPR